MRNAPPPKRRPSEQPNEERSIVPFRQNGKANSGDLQQKATYLPDCHRLLPQAIDAEKGVLCAFTLSPRDIGGKCAERQLTPEHFHLPAHAQIFTTLRKLWETDKPIDFITVTQALRNDGKLDQCGGAAYLTDLGGFVPTAANAGHYIETLEEKFLLRETIKICTEYAARSYDEQSAPLELVDELEKKVLAIRKGDADELRDEDPTEAIMHAANAIEALYNSRGEITGIPTGFAELDEILDGLHAPDMVVIAARPSVGKTAIAMNIAENIAVGNGTHPQRTVAFFSAEMSTAQINQRLLLSRSLVNAQRIRKGYADERDFPAINKAASDIAGSGKLRVIDAVGTTIGSIRAKARRLKRAHPDLAVVMIDYLQLIRSGTRQANNSREREVAEVSAGCKEMGKELDVAVVVLAQLNRDAEKRTGQSKGRPRLSDLRESGAIEQDGDIVMLLHREEVYAESEEEKRDTEGRATVIIAKQRNGPVGDVPLTFIKEFAKFENRARESAEDEELPQK